MSVNPKVAAALTLLENTSIARGSYAPWLHRMLWKIGVKLPPPHFAPFLLNVLLKGGFWFLFVGAFNLLYSHWRNYSTPEQNWVALVIGALLVGAVAAGFIQNEAQKFRIPSWKEFDNAN